MGPIITYKSPKGSDKEFDDFVEWKYHSYINPALELIPLTREFKFMKNIIEIGIPLGLVHPMGHSGDIIKEITKEELITLFEDSTGMSCMPYVVAYSLLNST